ncbi:hypothetical protein HMPREF9455_03431 [Dysgonomonas gadei ATCC BAA-286]|uniref:Uncharacterized protein n=1 Tax=Dysgonomonas gadei ATCC BAA-286 TaxID=742766 RepID=F5J236_9BACT|nr:hypothetical protein HMPREF9455_03431 [Dysgonomonas gadei ATCC BAA-286]
MECSGSGLGSLAIFILFVIWQIACVLIISCIYFWREFRFRMSAILYSSNFDTEFLFILVRECILEKTKSSVFLI